MFNNFGLVSFKLDLVALSLYPSSSRISWEKPNCYHVSIEIFMIKIGACSFRFHSLVIMLLLVGFYSFYLTQNGRILVCVCAFGCRCMGARQLLKRKKGGGGGRENPLEKHSFRVLVVVDGESQQT